MAAMLIRTERNRLVVKTHNGPIRIICEAFFLLRNKCIPLEPHIIKPDGDNLLKSVCDALQTGGLCDDDKVIYDKRIIKRYCDILRGPGILISAYFEHLAP
jgi:Holliday junction resolvase RusA-like endonuclease